MTEIAVILLGIGQLVWGIGTWLHINRVERNLNRLRDDLTGDGR